jgi:4-hydroxy-tetrahydrodipicolinate reductase
MKRIALFGICGKMGRAMLSELMLEKEIRIIAGFDKVNIGMDIGVLNGRDIIGVKVTDSYEDIIESSPDLIVDFTGPDVVFGNIKWALENSIDIIVGATGLKKEEIEFLRKKEKELKSKVFIVPNFSIGAVIMIIISKLSARYFENCEIIEMHHENKKDAPSGTSISTAESIGKIINYNESKLNKDEQENIEGSRGAFTNGIHLHSIRLPGLLAHQCVIFGSKGQTLTIKHDSFDRSSFYPGLVMAIKNIDNLSNFTYGLESLIKL